MTAKKKAAPKKKAPKKQAATPAAETATCTWNIDDPGDQNTFFMLRGLKQITQGFDDAKNLRMDQLASWNPAASPSMRRLTAAGLASHMDKVFKEVFRANVEPSYTNYHDRVDAVTNVLIDEGKTVCELAKTLDAIYRFREEQA